MTDPIFGVTDPDPEIYARIGKVATNWSRVETLMGEMLAHFCSADHGSMYVITQNVSNSTVVGWLRTLTEVRVKERDVSDVILNLLTEIDDTRAERNVVVHGIWRGHDAPGFAHVRTVRWERRDVAREELWSSNDLDDLISQIERLQLKLGNLGVTLGFLTREDIPPE
jgi:hypothetical protein